MSARRRYRTARIVFAVLSISFLLISIFIAVVGMPLSAGQGTPSPDAPSISSQDTDSVATTTAMLALLSSVISAVGLISTNLLAWRKDRRDSRLANIELEKQALALERERLALQKQRLELEKGATEDPKPGAR